MGGTRLGGLKARDTSIKRMGKEAYYEWVRERAVIGGKKKVPKGFAINKALAKKVGKKGGLTSRRGW